MNFKIISLILVALALAGGGGYYYLQTQNKTEAQPVSVAYEEVAMNTLLVQFNNSGRKKLLMMDLVFVVEDIHKESLESGLSKLKSKLLLDVGDAASKYNLKEQFQRQLQKDLSKFVASSSLQGIDEVLLMRAVIQ
ncbi:hypothetical protein [Vibrio barjaei]|uniref:hypothetical protein n=1 Tax=Vibrio barjaei TaxID=1676683 RepID=UPI002284850D|nr:hypothetical protein [Vibrio barjaei]MCY9872295.1 hypothetical protein [Vibrio barjaei]